MKKDTEKSGKEYDDAGAAGQREEKTLAGRLRMGGEALRNIAKIVNSRGVIDEKGLASISDGLRPSDIVLALQNLDKLLLAVAKLIEEPGRPTVDEPKIAIPPPPPPTFKGSMCFHPAPPEPPGPEAPQPRDH